MRWFRTRAGKVAHLNLGGGTSPCGIADTGIDAGGDVRQCSRCADAELPPPPRPIERAVTEEMNNSTAIDLLAAQLRQRGELRDDHVALVVTARQLARTIDKDPGNASLWREYAAAITRLTNAAEIASLTVDPEAEGGDDDDEIKRLINELVGGVPVRDTQDP